MRALVEINVRGHPDGRTVGDAGKDVKQGTLDDVKEDLVPRLQLVDVPIIRRKAIDANVVSEHQVQKNGEDPSDEIHDERNPREGDPSFAEDVKDSPEGFVDAERDKIVERTGWCF
mmetsp:Transcript_16044/g.37182  ORF Transcript_16044/g.37182 Transcript_16044/m.37182 type:complete len:116 (-) Transcript_16044:87-434(-)